MELCTDQRTASEIQALLDPHEDLFSAIMYLQTTDSLTRFDVPLADFTDEPDATNRSAKLDYCDFFYFNLVKILTTLPVVAQSGEKKIPGTKFAEAYRRFVSFGLGVSYNERSCRWNHDLVADTYLKVLQAHLEFALPTSHGREMNAFSCPTFRGKAASSCRLGEALSGIVHQLWLAQFSDVRVCMFINHLYLLM